MFTILLYWFFGVVTLQKRYLAYGVMAQKQDQNILEKNIKGVNIMVLWTIIFCTAFLVGIYFGMLGRVTLLEYRVTELEKLKGK